MKKSKPSANAQRVQRYKENKKVEGIEQVNVSAGEDARQAIKAIADRTNAGEPFASVLVDILARDQDDPVAERLKTLVDIGHRVQGLTGWRKRLAHFLGIM
ncbi:MAG: hypothetical protein ACYCTW_09190 [Sulfuricella sp.]